MMKKISILILYFFVLFISLKSQAQTNYKIVNKIHLQGNEKWDYLFSDDQAGRLYVSHGTIVQVVDETNGQLIGTIEGMKGVHGIAIVTDLGKGYISSGKDTTVVVFDTKTLKVLSKIKVSGLNPDAILFDPFSRKIFTSNGKSNSSTVIDPVTDKIVATIALEGKAESAVSDGKGKVYMNFEKESKLCQINATTFKSENVWPLAPGEEPTGLALDNENHRLFSTCNNKIMTVVDCMSGKVISTIPIGEDSDGAAFDPESGLIYSSNGGGTLTVVKEDKNDSFSVLENLPTQKGAKTITVNHKTHHIYLSASDFEPETDASQKAKIAANTFVVLDIAPIKLNK